VASERLGTTQYFRLHLTKCTLADTLPLLVVYCADSHHRLGPAGAGGCVCVHVITARALLRNVTLLRYRS